MAQEFLQLSAELESLYSESKVCTGEYSEHIDQTILMMPLTAMTQYV